MTAPRKESEVIFRQYDARMVSLLASSFLTQHKPVNIFLIIKKKTDTDHYKHDNDFFKAHDHYIVHIIQCSLQWSTLD